GVAPRVFAVGDLATVELPGRWYPEVRLVLPKAGVFAAAEGEVVGERIAEALGGGSAAASFGGRGHCYIEVGGGRAMRGDGAFFAMPHPEMSARAPDEAQFRDKLQWGRGALSPPETEDPRAARGRPGGGGGGAAGRRGPRGRR